VKWQIYLRLLFFLAILYFVGIGFIFFFQKRILFQPDQLAADYQFEFDVPFREIFLDSKDGEKINALYFNARDTTKGVILYFHGNSDNLQRWGQYHKDFTERGYDFFAIDFRGFGKSTGEIIEQNFYADAQLAYDWVAQKFPAEQIILYGRSMGTGVVSHLATQVKAKMLILETPYDNIKDLLLTRMPALPLPFQLNYQFPTDQRIANIMFPIYIFHGTKDNIVPYRAAFRLEPLLSAKDQFITIEGGGHKNLSEFELFQSSLDRILN